MVSEEIKYKYDLAEDLVQYENFYSKKIIQDKELGPLISWKNLFQII